MEPTFFTTATVNTPLSPEELQELHGWSPENFAYLRATAPRRMGLRRSSCWRSFPLNTEGRPLLQPCCLISRFPIGSFSHCGRILPAQRGSWQPLSPLMGPVAAPLAWLEPVLPT